MAQMSRRCVPYTPFDRPLDRATIALVTAAGVHRRDQEPFNTADEIGDLTYRAIGPDASAADLMVTHHHYDHRDADRDVNVVFPVDRLRELADAGVIGGIAKLHVGFMGYAMKLRQMYDETAPAIAADIERLSKADAVVLTGGWPQVCHRTVVAVQREIEMRGLSTVLITVSPEASRQMRPPRALYPRGFDIGNALGRPGMVDLQRRVLADALGLLSAPARPGEIVEVDYPDYAQSAAVRPPPA